MTAATEVKHRMKTFTATRHLSYTTFRSPEPETYCLMFSFTQGDHYISVKFRDQHEHDAINVWDYEKDVPKISEWGEFRALVSEYVNAKTRDELRLDWVGR
jgi:hypothetical protein